MSRKVVGYDPHFPKARRINVSGGVYTVTPDLSDSKMYLVHVTTNGAITINAPIQLGQALGTKDTSAKELWFYFYKDGSFTMAEPSWNAAFRTNFSSIKVTTNGKMTGCGFRWLQTDTLPSLWVPAGPPISTEF